MKSAGTNRNGKKLSASNYAALSSATPFSRNETQKINRQALAVVDAPEFDESASPFFAQDNGVTNLPEADIATLDQMIESRGLANVLKAVQGLLESRIEEGMQAGGTVLLHLSRDDAWARAAERLRDLAFHPDIATL